VVLTGWGCRPHSAGAGGEPPASHQPGPTSSAPLPLASASAEPEPLPPLVVEGCFAELATNEAPARQLQAVSEACALAASGPAIETREFALGEGAEHQVPIQLGANQCARLVAAGAASLAEVELSLLAPDGSLVASDPMTGSLAVLGPDGPVCVASPGRYRARTIARRGTGQLALGIWLTR
jgi:hypothetical protein